MQPFVFIIEKLGLRDYDVYRFPTHVDRVIMDSAWDAFKHGHRLLHEILKFA